MKVKKRMMNVMNNNQNDVMSKSISYFVPQKIDTSNKYVVSTMPQKETN